MADSPCCPPLADGPISSEQAVDLATVFKALADPVRLRILSALIAADGQICACDFVAVAARSQPTVSHHLRVLREAGLIESERRGTWVWYAVVPARLADVRRTLAVDDNASLVGSTALP